MKTGKHALGSSDVRAAGRLRGPGIWHLANNRGVALVLTLFVVALVSVLVLEYYFDASVEIDLAANYASDAQAYYLALSGVNLAQALLLRDADRDVDGPQDLWYRLGAVPVCVPPQQLLALVSEASSSAPLTLDRFTGFAEATSSEVACISLRIVDEQSKLPLNALVQAGAAQGGPPGGPPNAPRPARPGRPTNPRQGQPPAPNPMECRSENADWKPIFKRLFESLRIEEDKLAAVVDWLDQDHDPCGLGGAENAYYETLKPRYKARNALMRTPGELRLVRGFDFATLAKLFPGFPPDSMADADLGTNLYLTPYGDQQAKVNLNTASTEVLRILLTGLYESSGIMDDLADQIVAKRQEAQLPDLAWVKERILREADKLERVAAVQSTHFRVTSTGTLGAIQKRAVAILKRDGDTLALAYLKVE